MTAVTILVSTFAWLGTLSEIVIPIQTGKTKLISRSYMSPLSKRFLFENCAIPFGMVAFAH